METIMTPQTIPLGSANDAAKALTPLFKLAKANGKNAKPVLGSLRFAPSGSGYSAVATTVDVFLRIDVDRDAPAVQRAPGDTCLVPSAFLEKNLKALGKHDVALTWDEAGKVTLLSHTDNSEVTFRTEDVAEFPSFPTAPEGSFGAFDCAGADLHHLLATAAAERSRFAFNAICLDKSDTGFRMITTDGKRLLAIQHDAERHDDHSILLPDCAARAMLDVIGKSGDMTADVFNDRCERDVTVRLEAMDGGPSYVVAPAASWASGGRPSVATAA